MKKILLCLITVSIFTACGVSRSVHHKPQTDGYNQQVPVVTKHSPTTFTSGDNFLFKNKQNNLWEMYVDGDALQRGLLMGSLGDSLVKKQEAVFFNKIRQIIPSTFKQRLLRQFLKIYNRKLYLNVSEEYQTEIFGLSKYASEDFEYVAPKYLRTLYLHGAHDIGHALTDLSLVGCTSFAVWGDQSADGSLLIGRNLDFYAGDKFAEDKVVYFMKPEKGHPYMSVSWPGMIGVVSGMNLEGLTVTINAGKSDVPWSAKTPISILAREILQYAKNIDEAIAIAKQREVFVSESIMIGSAIDKKAILIEVSPQHFGVYEVPNTPKLVCSNHFQSETYKDDKNNQKHIVDSHSKYRYDRMEELLTENGKIDTKEAVAILRDTDGLNDLKIGYGNEKSLNQLLAHHAIVFKPEQRLVWISANPYQLGEFVCYDLNKVFAKKIEQRKLVTMAETNMNIPKDPFLETQAYKNYEKYRAESHKFDEVLKDKDAVLTDQYIVEYKALNPEYWWVYYQAATYYQQKKQYDKALANYQVALTKEITTLPEKLEIEKQVKKLRRKVD
ncbi:MAG TPA: C45 family peptidase [Flavobacterium sp.]|nr:C45 family peptidase [Flavobacterium sp.]